MRVGLFASCLGVLLLAGQADAAPGVPLPETAVAAWREHSAPDLMLSGTITTTLREFDEAGVLRKSSVAVDRLKRAPFGTCLEKLPRDQGPPFSRVYGRNSQYSFSAARRSGETKYLLKGHTPDPHVTSELGGGPLHEITGLMVVPYSVANVPVLELRDATKWRVSAVAPSPDNSDLTRVTFDNPGPQDGGEQEAVVVSGWGDFDCSRAWHCVRGGYALRRRGAETMTTFENTIRLSGSHPVLIGRNTRTTGPVNPQGSPRVERIDTYDLEDATLTEQDFTLSAYGLPEPAGVVWGHTAPRYGWLTLAAVWVPVLALLLRRLTARRSSDSERA